MGKTNLSIRGRDFYINGKPVYDEIKSNDNSKGLLMNARFIQGIFDDKTNTLCGFTNKSIIHFSHGKIDNTLQSTKLFLPASFRSSLPGFESMVNLNDHSYF